MAKPRVLVLTGDGINCDEETEFCFNNAGATAERIHINLLLGGEKKVKDYQILAFPGGFLHADDIAAGKVMATKIKYGKIEGGKPLMDDIQEFITDGKLIIGICNGFQALVKAGLLPGLNGNEQEVTLTNNDSGRFEDRWVYLDLVSKKCVWTRNIEGIYLPVRHGEGKFIPRDEEVLKRLYEQELVVAKYVGPEGEENPGYPWNPNGSVDDIAAICDPTGRVLGTMPHHEGYFDRVQHPRWAREKLPEEGMGMQVFRNGVKYANEL